MLGVFRPDLNVHGLIAADVKQFVLLLQPVVFTVGVHDTERKALTQ